MGAACRSHARRGLGICRCARLGKGIEQFQKFYELYEAKTKGSDQSSEAYPPLQDGQPINCLAKLSLFGLPMLFVGLWALVLGVQVGKRVMG